MRDAGQVQVYSGNPFAGMPGLRLDSKRGVIASARRILQASGIDPRDRRNDALTMAFARELEDVIKEVFDVEYPELRAREFLPERTVSPEAATFTYRMVNRVGAADIINENGSNIPKVDIEAKEWQQPIVTWGASYDFTLLDQMRSGRLGISVDSLKAEAARWACEYKLEQLAAVGDATLGLVGLVNAPGVAASTQASTGTWLAQIASIATATTTNATPPAVVVTQAIAGDLGVMMNNIFVNTEGIHTATDCLVPVSIYNALKITPQSPGFNSKSILQYLEELTGLEFNCWPQLNASDTVGHNGVHGQVVVYKRDPKIVNLMMAMQFTQQPPQPVKLAWEINCWMRGGAAQVRYPLAVTYMNGLG